MTKKTDENYDLLIYALSLIFYGPERELTFLRNKTMIISARQDHVFKNLIDIFATAKLFPRIKFVNQKPDPNIQYDKCDCVIQITAFKKFERIVCDVFDPKNLTVSYCTMIWTLSTIRRDHDRTKLETSFYSNNTFPHIPNPIGLKVPSRKVAFPIALTSAIFTGLGTLQQSAAAAYDGYSASSLSSASTIGSSSKMLIIMGIVAGTTFAGISVPAYIHTEELLDKTDHWPSCIEEYMVVPEDAILNTQFSSINKMLNLESLKKEMHLAADIAHDRRDFPRSIEVPSTVLRLIDATDVTSLSQLAVAFRDADHHNMDRLTCSEIVHELPQVKAKVFGKMALAEDKLLLGKHPESINIISPVIDAYETQSNMLVEKPSYVNSLIIRGNAYLAMENYDAAEHDYLLSMERGGEQADPLYGLGNVEFRRNGDFAQSEIYFDKAMEHDPTNSDIIGMYIRSLIFMEKYDVVKAEYDRLLDEHPNIAKIITDENPKLKDIVHYDVNIT